MFGQGHFDDLLTNGAAIEPAVTTGKHQQRQAGSTDKIGLADQSPVAQQKCTDDLAVGQGHGQQVVAGKQLGPRHHQQQQTKRKHEATENRTGRKAQRRQLCFGDTHRFRAARRRRTRTDQICDSLFAYEV